MQVGPIKIQLPHWLRQLIAFLKELGYEWSKDKCFHLSAAVSYYTVFSIAPSLVIIVYTAGYFFGQEAVEGEIIHRISEFIGPQVAQSVQTLLKNVYFDLDRLSSFQGWISMGTLVVTATLTFTVMQSALNTVWDVKIRSDKSITNLVMARVMAFAMVLLIGATIAASLLLSTLLQVLTGYITDLIGFGAAIAAKLLDYLIAFAFLTFLFGALYKFLPDVRIRWRHVWRGALLASFLFGIGRFGIAFYLGTNNLNSTYGAASSLVLLILWVNYSAWIFFLGAEFIQVWTRRHGVEVPSNGLSVRYVAQEVGDQHFASEHYSAFYKETPFKAANEKLGKEQPGKAANKQQNPGSGEE